MMCVSRIVLRCVLFAKQGLVSDSEDLIVQRDSSKIGGDVD